MSRYDDSEQFHNEWLRRCGMDPDEDHLWEAHEADQRADRQSDKRPVGDQRRELFDERRARNALRPRTGDVSVQPRSRAA